MFPYPHRRSIAATSESAPNNQQQQQGRRRRTPQKITTLDDAIRTDLQHDLLPLYQQRLQQQYQPDYNTQMSRMNHNSSNTTTNSVYSKVFLPHFIETKMGLLLRRQSIVTTTTTTTTSTSNSYYYGFLPTQRCDYHSYIQFVFTIIQEYIQSTMRMIRSVPITSNNNNNHPNLEIDDDDDDDTSTMSLITLSFYIFTFYTWIQMLHPPPPPHTSDHHRTSCSSTQHTKTTTISIPHHHHHNNNKSDDTILLSYLSMGLQSFDNPKVLYRRMYDHFTKIRMTSSFYHSLVQLLQQMSIRIGSTVQHVPTIFSSCNSDYNHHQQQQYSRTSRCRSNMIQKILQNDIIHILQRLLNYTDQYFDLSSYHGPCHLEGYTWHKQQQQQQQQHGHPEPPMPLRKSKTVIPTNTITHTTFHPPPPASHTDTPTTTMTTNELKQSDDDGDDDSAADNNRSVKESETSAAATSIHAKIRSYWQLHNLNQSIVTNVNNAIDPSNNPLLHLLRTYYNDGSRTHLDNDNEHMDIENGLLVNIETVTNNTINHHNDEMTNPIIVTTNQPMESHVPIRRRNQMLDELPQRRSGDDIVSASHHELEEALIWDDSDESDDNVINTSNDKVHDDDDDDDNNSFASSIPNNIGTTALSKLLQHVTDHHHQPSPSSRPSNITYGDFFLLPPNEDMESKLSTIDVQQRTKQNTIKKQNTKLHRKVSKSKPSEIKRKRPSKKSLPSTPKAVLDGTLAFGDQNHEIYDDYDDDDDDNNIIIDDYDNAYEEDSSYHETNLATPGQSALSKLLAMARPV